MTAQTAGVEALTARIADAIDTYPGTVTTTVYRRASAYDPADSDYSAETAPRRTVPESEVRAAMGRIAQALRDYSHRWTSTYPPADDLEALRNADLRVRPGWYVYATPVEGPLAQVIWWTGEAIDLHQQARDPSTAIARASAALEEMNA